MKSIFIKTILVFLLLTGLSTVLPTRVLADPPSIGGYVRTAGVGIGGVTVVMTQAGGEPAPPDNGGGNDINDNWDRGYNYDSSKKTISSLFNFRKLLGTGNALIPQAQAYGQRTASTDGSGFFLFPADWGWGCGTAPQYMSANVQGYNCPSTTTGPYGNVPEQKIVPPIDCTPVTPPTPIPTATPSPTPAACGAPCTTNNQCNLQCPICAGGVCVAPSPTPTVTPLPTATATPTLTPTVTPTPTPQCDCYGLEAQGIFYSGTNVDVTGYAAVRNPDTNPAEVLSMVYTLSHNNQVIATSGEKRVGAPERKKDTSGVPIDRYNSSWSFSIPAPGPYKIEEQIYCGWKSPPGSATPTPTGPTPTPGGATPTPTRTPTPSPKPQAMGSKSSFVLGTSTSNNGNIFSSFFQWFGSIFSPKGNPSPQQSVEPTLTPTPTPTPFNPKTAKSLKLTTLSPDLVTSCKEATFNAPL